MTGRSRYFGLKKEDEYGTIETDPSTRYEDTETKIQADPNWILAEPVATRAYKKRAQGLYRAQGNVGDFQVTPNGIIGDLMLAVFGSETPTNNETGVYTHVFSPADTIPSYTGRIGAELIERVLPGLLCEELTLKWNAGQPVTASALLYSGFAEESDTIVAAPTIDTLQPFTQIDDLVNLTWNGDSTRAAAVSSLDVTIKNNIPFNLGDLSGNTFSKIRVGQRTVTGNVTAYFDDTDDYDLFVAGTAFDFTLATATTFIGASETYRNTIGLNVYDCQFMRNAAPDVKSQSEPLVINAPFQAFYDSGASKEVSGLLRNSIAAY